MAYAVTVPPVAGGVHAHVTDDLSELETCVTPPSQLACACTTLESVDARLPALALANADGGDDPGNVAAMKPLNVCAGRKRGGGGVTGHAPVGRLAI
jgi:hypothetical protein